MIDILFGIVYLRPRLLEASSLLPVALACMPACLDQSTVQLEGFAVRKELKSVLAIIALTFSEPSPAPTA